MKFNGFKSFFKEQTEKLTKTGRYRLKPVRKSSEIEDIKPYFPEVEQALSELKKKEKRKQEKEEEKETQLKLFEERLEKIIYIEEATGFSFIQRIIKILSPQTDVDKEAFIRVEKGTATREHYKTIDAFYENNFSWNIIQGKFGQKLIEDALEFLKNNPAMSYGELTYPEFIALTFIIKESRGSTKGSLMTKGYFITDFIKEKLLDFKRKELKITKPMIQPSIMQKIK